MLSYKSIPFEVKEIVDVAGGGWEVSGLASTWGGEPDSYGDVVVRGAFAESIARRATKFLFEHREPIGKQLHIEENDEGLFGRWSIIDTRAGTDAYKLIKGGALDSLSIGYMTLEADYREDGVRLLRKVDLYEVSAVAIPANANAIITDVKSRPFDSHFQDVRVAVQEWLQRVQSGSDMRAAKGREPLTAERRAALEAMSGSLRQTADAMDALLVPPAPPERINVGLELRKLRLQRRGILERPAS